MIAEKTFSKTKTEQEFKMLYVNKVLKPMYKYVFCIETEETVKGFPDVMCITNEGKTHFFEFKYAKTDKIKFQPTQPAFYKKYSELDIWVVSYKAKTNQVVIFNVSEMSSKDENAKYFINSRAEVYV